MSNATASVVNAAYPFLDKAFRGSSLYERTWAWLVHDVFADKPWALFVSFYLFMTACYITGGAFFWVLEQFRVFPDYRIQPGKWPSNSDYVKTLKNIFQNYVVVILPMCFIAPPVLEYVGISAYAPLPSGKRLLVDLLFCMFVEDVFQYIFHRLLHLPSLYPLIHKVHHEWSTPFAMAASYAHPAEIFILALAAFAGPLFCRPHLASFFAWLLFRQMDAVKTHSGWVWPGIDHVLHFIPYYEGAVFHDYHHRSFIFNYASRFTFIDLIFRTYKVPFDPLRSTSSKQIPSASESQSIDAIKAMETGAQLNEAPFVFETKKSPATGRKRTASPKRASPRRKKE